MGKIGATISLVLAFFLFVSMLMQLDTRVMGTIAIAALLALAVYQSTRQAPGEK
jgi:hypothetical protein